MTKTELLEQMLAELKAIHAALETPADLPTPADDEPHAPDDYAQRHMSRFINGLKDDVVYIIPDDKAGRY